MEQNHACKIHQDEVLALQNNLIDEALLYDVADLFKLFSDSTRIKILVVLFNKEFCVCDIAALLEMSQSSISHQLRLLKQSHLVKTRRAGKSSYYSLADDHVKMIINQGLEHAKEPK